MKSFLLRIRKHLTRLAKPLTVIPQVQGAFWIFVLVTIVFGQTSIWLPLLFSVGNQNMTFGAVLTDRLIAGSFYTFSISLIASRITPFLTEYLDKRDIRFRHIKVIT